MKKLILILLVIATSHFGFSQNYKLGKVSKEELQEKYYPLDSSVSAAYLYKNRRTYFDYNQQDGFIIITEVHERIKIYNKDGYDWATKSISFYSPDSGNSEKVIVKDAKTFSIVGGKVKSEKLAKKALFKESTNKYWAKKKFTMPNVSVGSVIEWKYKIISPYFRINKLELQHSIPMKKVTSTINIPEYFKYNSKSIGYLPVDIKTNNKTRNIKYTYRNKLTDLANNSKTEASMETMEFLETIYQIDKNNIPALYQESYVNNIDNYRSMIEYELSSIKWPNTPTKYYAKTWDDVAKTILKNSRFGEELKKTNYLKDDLITLNSSLTTTSAKIYGALEFVKNKIKWNDYTGKYTEKGLRKAYKEGVGNIADINLTLVAVLRELGINANPVLVSTRSNGVPNFPTLSGFNYVIVYAETSEGNVLLDASEKYSLPNVLPLRALNWQGAIVRPDKTIDFINLGSSTISFEELNMSYKISNDGMIEGMNRVKYKNSAALDYRIKNGSNSEESIISKTEENNDIEILNFRLSNIHDLSKPVAKMYKFEKEDGVEIIGNKMYFTPLLFSATTENPFKLKNREYPIDFGTSNEEKIIVSIQIPEGYTIESLPENVAIGMSEDLGTFIYSVKNQGGKIQIVSDIKINTGIIPATYYAEIKEMFKQIVSKQTEKIVLSKN
jgi:hypothetical protein